MLVFDEEFGYLTSFEDEDSDDGSEGGELRINQLIGDFKYDSIIYASK